MYSTVIMGVRESIEMNIKIAFWTYQDSHGYRRSSSPSIPGIWPASGYSSLSGHFMWQRGEQFFMEKIIPCFFPLEISFDGMPQHDNSAKNIFEDKMFQPEDFLRLFSHVWSLTTRNAGRPVTYINDGRTQCGHHLLTKGFRNARQGATLPW